MQLDMGSCRRLQPMLDARRADRRPLVCLCDQLKALGVHLNWNERTRRAGNGALLVHVIPKLAPEFLAEQWKVLLGEDQELETFDLQFSCTFSCT